MTDRPTTTTTGTAAYAKQESELVPAAIVICLVDAHAFREQANQECDWCDQPVPEASPESRRLCTRLFVFRV